MKQTKQEAKSRLAAERVELGPVVRTPPCDLQRVLLFYFGGTASITPQQRGGDER